MNALGNVTLPSVQLELVRQLADLSVSGGSGVSTKEELKEFSLSFRSVGAGACVFIDFNDGTRATYGDAYYCRVWKPSEKHVPGVTVEQFMTITHKY